MMDDSGCRIVARDWREDFKNEVRQQIVGKIFEKLKERLSPYNVDAVTLKRLTDLATSFEKEMFSKAKSKDHYVKGISKKMTMVGNRLRIDVPSANPNAIQESSSIQHLPAFSSDVNDKCGVQMKKEEVFVSNPSSQMVNQPFQQPVAPYQPLQKNIKQLNVDFLPQSSIHVNHQPPQRNQTISKESRNQHLLKSALTSKPHDQLQLNQQFRMPNQSSVHAQNMLNSSYQSQGLQIHVSGIQMSRDMLTPHSNVLNLQPNENLTGQIKEVTSPHEVKQTVADEQRKPHQPHQPNQVAISLLQNHRVIEQNKPHQPNVVHMAFSSASMEKVQDWSDQAYLELQCLKETHLPVLRKAYEKISEHCSLVGQTEMIQKFKGNMVAMEKMMSFLELPRNRIINFPKEKFYLLKQSVVHYIESLGSRNTNLFNKQAPHGKPGLHRSHTSLVQGGDNVNPHFQQVKMGPIGYPNSCSPKPPRQMGSLRPGENKITLPHSNSESSVECRNMPTPLQKRQHASHVAQSQNIKQEFQSSWILKQKSMEDIQAINSSGESWQQHLNSEFSPQLQVASSNFPNEASQISQASLQIDQLKVPKEPLPSGRASPSTPLSPPSITIGVGNNPPNDSCFSNFDDFQYPQACNTSNIPNTRMEIKIQSQEIRSSGTLTPPLLSDPTSLGSNQQPLTAPQPLKRLLKAVESMSNEALRAAVSEMNLVGHMNDTMTEGIPFETSCHQYATPINLQDGRGLSNNLKRNITATTLNEMSSPCREIDGSEQSVCQIDNLGSTATATSRKKLKTLCNNALLDDMRNINQQLVETVLELESAENVDRRFANAGTVLRCSYSAIAVGKNLKFHLADSQKLPVLSLKLLVPVDYPNIYPVIINKFTSDCSSDDEEFKELLSTAKLKLREIIRAAPGHLSLAELARAWDQCARAVVFERVQSVGGERLSSRYGTWEDCVATT